MPYIKSSEWKQIQEQLKQKNRNVVYPEVSLPKQGKPRAEPMAGHEIFQVCENEDSCLGPLLNFYNNTQIRKYPTAMSDFLDTIYGLCRSELAGNDSITLYKMFKTGDWVNHYYLSDTRFEFIKQVGCFILSQSVNRDLYGDLDKGEYRDADAAGAELIACFDALALELTGRTWDDADETRWLA